MGPWESALTSPRVVLRGVQVWRTTGLGFNPETPPLPPREVEMAVDSL